MMNIYYKTGLAVLLIFIGLLSLWTIFRDDIFVISNTSMENSVFPGDYIFTRKSKQLIDKSLLGKICMVHLNQFNDNKVYIKRCVGLPGDTLLIYNKKEFVNLNHQLDHNINSFLRNYYLVWADSCDQYKTILLLQSIASAGAQIKVDKHLNCLKVVLSGLQLEKLRESQLDLIILSQLDYFKNDSSIIVDTLVVPFKGMPLEQVNMNYYRNADAVASKLLFVNNDNGDKAVISKNYYFFAGDNRPRSLDSRTWGPIPEVSLLRQATFILFSKDKDQIRWRRFFKKI